MGDIGAEKLKNNGTTTPKNFQIRLQDCVFDTQETMTTTFTGTVSSANSGNYYTIFNTDTGAAFNNVSPRSVTLWVPLTKAAWVLTRKS